MATDIEEVTDQCEQEIFSITKIRDEGKTLNIMFDTMQDVIEEITQQHKRIELPSVMTGYISLDKILNGLHKSNLIILAARPAAGKTSLAINIAMNVVKRYKTPIAIFSLEMSCQELSYRLISSELGIEVGRLTTGAINEDEFSPINDFSKQIHELPIYINDNASITVNEMRSQCRQLMATTKQNLGLIVVDYLQLIEAKEVKHKLNENRNQEISYYTRSFKKLAKELDCPILVLSQLNRDTEKRSENRPKLSDLRESGSIEQDADVVLFVYRDEDYNKTNSKFPGISELIIGKNRHGSKASVFLRFQPEFTRFVNLEYELEP